MQAFCAHQPCGKYLTLSGGRGITYEQQKRY